MQSFKQRKYSKTRTPGTVQYMNKRVSSSGHEVIRRQPGQVELVISDQIVEKIMGPDPVPSLDIEYPMIMNEL